jgi:ankyrin repeat protein
MKKENVVNKTLELKSKYVKSVKHDSMSVLSFYIKDKNFRKFKAVLESSNHHIDQTHSNGESLLTIAVKYSCYDIVKYLINNEANINILDNENNTPLHHALKNKNYKIANLLIENKADEYIPNNRGQTPWMFMNHQNA